MEGNIYITGLIGSIYDEQGKLVEKGTELVDVIMQVKKQPNAEKFNVYINSEGGVVETGYEIYNYLKDLGKPIKTIGQELVGSIATIIFAVGGERELKSGTVFHPHLPSGGVQGTSKDIQVYAHNIAETEKRMLKTYKEDVGLSETEILPILTKDESLTAEQAYGLGFANVKTEPTPVVAYFNTDKSKKPKPMSKDKGIIAKMKAILNGLPISNKIVFDAQSKELDFYELSDDATIEVGAKANYDGKPAEGEYKVQSEEDAEVVLTYVFAAGVLTEIQEPATDDTEEEVEEMTALKAEVEELKAQLLEKEVIETTLTAEVTALKTANKSYQKAFTAIKALESDATPPATTKTKPTPSNVNAVSLAVTNWRNNKQLKTKK